MNEVIIAGVGMTRWGKWNDLTSVDLGVEAARKALADSGLEWRNIQLLVSGESRFAGTNGFLMGNVLAKELGWSGIPALNIYNACSSGTYAVRIAQMHVAAGMCDAVLCVGYDKSPIGFFSPPYDRSWDYTDLDTQRLRLLGLTNPTIFALHAMRRRELYGTTDTDLAKVKVKSSKHGVLNPYARYQREFTMEEIVNSPMVCSPLRLYEIAATSDGAAAVVICSQKLAKTLTSKPIILAGISCTTPSYPENEPALMWLSSDSTYSRPIPEVNQQQTAALLAYEESGIGPEDLSLAEVYDLSANLELDWYEYIGLCAPGEAEELLSEGATSLGGRIPVNPSGGVSAFGESVPAQSLAQMCELVWQLRGEAGARQVEGAKTALAINMGLMGNISCAILKR